MDIANKSPSLYKVMEESGLIVTGSAVLVGVLLKHDTSNDPTFNFYDWTSAVEAHYVLGDTWENSTPIGWVDSPIRFRYGLYMEISDLGTGKFTVFYRRGSS